MVSKPHCPIGGICIMIGMRRLKIKRLFGLNKKLINNSHDLRIYIRILKLQKELLKGFYLV